MTLADQTNILVIVLFKGHNLLQEVPHLIISQLVKISNSTGQLIVFLLSAHSAHKGLAGVANKVLHAVDMSFAESVQRVLFLFLSWSQH